MALFRTGNGGNQPNPTQNNNHGGARVKSVLRYTMMPEILPRIRALGFHFGHFAYLLALVFASARLIPQNHPVMNAANMGRFGIRQVIAIAANNVTWSTKNIDQIAIFSAIVIGLIMIVIQAGLIAIAALVGFNPAEANSGSFFETPDPSEDPIMILFAQVFGELNGFWGSGVAANAPASDHAIHEGIRNMLSLYSMAMMVIAVIVVLYYVLTVVGETAQSGTPFGGRFNSLWAPIRLVIALGLLIPLGSGLNSAQYITLWVAKMGSGLGTQVWNQVLPSLASSDSSDYVLGNFQNEWVSDAAVNIFIMKACMHAYNKNLSVSDDSPMRMRQRADFESSEKKITIAFDNGTTDDRAYDTKRRGTRYYSPRSCGKMTVDLEENDSASAVTSVVPLQEIFKASKEVLKTLVESAEIDKFAVAYAENNTSIGGRGINEENLRDAFDEVLEVAEKAMSNISLDMDTKFTKEFDKKLLAYIDDRANSWVYSGVWYLDISRLIEATKNAEGKVVPNMVEGLVKVEKSLTSYGNLTNIFGFSGNAINLKKRAWGYGDEERAAEFYAIDTKNINSEVQQLVNGAFVFYNSYKSEIIDESKLPTPCHTDNRGTWAGQIGCTIVSMLVPEQLVVLAENNDLRIGRDGEKIAPAAGKTFRTMNPMAALMNAGHTIVYRSFAFISLGLGANLGSGLASLIPGRLGSVLESVLSGLGGILILIGALGLTAGLILFFLLPVMPFIYFFFAIVSWVMEIFEAVVAMPLWALSFLQISGDGLPGPTAMNGIYLLFAILLRPALIVIGLIAGIVIFGGIVFLLQNLWADVLLVKGDGSMSGLEVLIYTLVFAYFCYSAAVTSFKLVDTIPNQILRWIGSNPGTFSDNKEDPASGASNVLTAGAGFLAGSGLSQASGAFSQGGKKGIEGLKGSRIGDRFKSSDEKMKEKMGQIQQETAIRQARKEGVDVDSILKDK